MTKKNMPRLKIGLSLFTDNNDIEIMNEISRFIGIDPTSSNIKGEPRKNAINAYHNCSTWYYSTEYVYGFNLEDLVNRFLLLFADKVSIINKVKERYQMEALIDICCIFRDGETPSMLLNRDFICFVNDIGATIDIDCYCK